jgi:hypothetical protein
MKSLALIKSGEMNETKKRKLWRKLVQEKWMLLSQNSFFKSQNKNNLLL